MMPHMTLFRRWTAGRARGPAAVFVLAWGLAGALAHASTYRFEQLKAGAQLGDYAVRFVPRGRAKDFVLETTLKTTAGGPAARILFGYQDEGNHYYAEASDTNCIFVKVEDGIERRIGTPSTAQIARDASVQLAVIRWRHTMGLWLNGRQVAEAYDGSFRGGAVGLAPRKESAAVEKVTFQVVGDVRFADDFMRTSAEEKAWEKASGSWALQSLPSASLSANAFYFVGKAASAEAPALALRGHWFWHNYTVSAACRPLGEAAVGLVFYSRGPQDYHLLRWEPRTQGGRLQLCRVAGGQRHVLATTSLGFTPEHWYELKVRIVGRRATAYIDGSAELTATDPALLCGRIGLYCEGQDGALFDDVEVTLPRDFEESFEREITGKWTAFGGTWSRKAGALTPDGPAGHILQAAAPKEARYISGEQGWDGYTARTEVRPDPKGTVGLVACYQDEANYYVFSLSPEAAVLSRVAEGEPTELARAARPQPDTGRHVLEFTVDRGVLTGRLDGQVLVRRCDRTLREGRAGLFVRETADAAFDNFAVRMARRPTPLFSPHNVFAAETSMAEWAVQQSDWLPVKETVDGAERTVLWHRADLPGDVEVAAKLDGLAQDSAASVVLAGDGQHAASGYRVSLARQEKTYTITIARQGKPVAQEALTLAHAPRLFGAERVGHAVLAQVDGKVVLTYEDKEPLGGRRVAWLASGVELAKSGVELFSRSVRVYAFHEAPVDWRAAAGHWEVTNRWHCDPRWSFFAGEHKDDKLVALWNKRLFGPEVTLEFAAGIRHDPNRGHTNYVYASDINAVICGDGTDLRKGYNIIFGGWGNKHTRILRDGEVVADTTKFVMPGNSSQHRYWFYVKIQKQGGRVRLFVDNQLALEYNDPKPLSGNHVAIWSWDNDLMIARARVSAPGPAPCERPVGPPPEKPHCIYR
jgi:hypothetical protein